MLHGKLLWNIWVRMPTRSGGCSCIRSGELIRLSLPCSPSLAPQILQLVTFCPTLYPTAEGERGPARSPTSGKDHPTKTGRISGLFGIYSRVIIEPPVPLEDLCLNLLMEWALRLTVHRIASTDTFLHQGSKVNRLKLAQQ
jgi:hypothetical protein